MSILPPSLEWTPNSLPSLSSLPENADFWEAVEREALGELEKLQARQSFREFVRRFSMEPPPARHHNLLIEKLQAVAEGRIRRLMLFLPPGSAKSTYASVLFPPWFLARYPDKKILAASHTMELAERFGRRVRNIVGAPEYGTAFGVKLADDSQAAGRWATDQGGEYIAAGVGKAIAGTRADLGLIDDPIGTRQDADSETVRRNLWEWYKSDFWTRLKPGAGVVLIQTRWHVDDLAGKLLKDMADGGEQWEVLSLPMLATSFNDPLGRRLSEPLWPEWYTPQMLKQAQRDSRAWSSLYQQEPTLDGGNIFHKDWWQRWPRKSPPECEYIIQSWDTAFKDGQENDYSARTTWGIFWHEGVDGIESPCAILLERFKDRLSYPALREEALEAYKEWRPDAVIIEDKASGQSLIQELRRSGLPIKAVKADRDKVSRAHAVTGVFEQGCVWYMDRDWAREVIDDMASFPRGPLGSADITDSAVHALAYLRRTFNLRTPGEIKQERDEDAEDYTPIRTGDRFGGWYG